MNNEWYQLEEVANRDTIPAQNKIKVETTKKVVFAMDNLSLSIGSMQKKIAQRLDTLNHELSTASSESSKQSKRLYYLTIALVIATIVQAVSAVLILLK